MIIPLCGISGGGYRNREKGIRTVVRAGSNPTLPFTKSLTPFALRCSNLLFTLITQTLPLFTYPFLLTPFYLPPHYPEGVRTTF